MFVRCCCVLVLMGMLGSLACTSPTTTPGSDLPPPDLPPPPRKERPEAALEDTLKDAVRAYHEDLASGDRDRQKQALATFLCNKTDIERLFPGREPFWGLLEEGLPGSNEEFTKLATEAANRGAIKAIRVEDLRQHARATGSGPMLSKIAEDLPVYQAIVECEKGTVSLDPLFFVNRRWAWYPHLQRVAIGIPAQNSNER